MRRAGLEHAGHWACHLQPQSNTSTTSSQLVELAVVAGGSLAVLGGQQFYSAEEGEEAVLVVRASTQFSHCQADTRPPTLAPVLSLITAGQQGPDAAPGGVLGNPGGL